MDEVLYIYPKRDIRSAFTRNRDNLRTVYDWQSMYVCMYVCTYVEVCPTLHVSPVLQTVEMALTP